MTQPDEQPLIEKPKRGRPSLKKKKLEPTVIENPEQALDIVDIFYSVIGQVVSDVKEDFRKEGISTEVLSQLKEKWITKMRASGAVGAFENEKQRAFVEKFTSARFAIEIPPLTEAFKQLQIRQEPSAGTNGTAHQESGLRNKSAGGMKGKASKNQSAKSEPLVKKPPKISAPHRPTASIVVRRKSLVSGVVHHNRNTRRASAVRHREALQVPVDEVQVIVPLIQLDGGAAAMDDTSTSDEEFEPEAQGAQDEVDDAGDEFPDDFGAMDDADDLEPPLNSDDDDPDDDALALETPEENTIVCKFEKVRPMRGKSAWELHLKDDVMKIEGVDYIFKSSDNSVEILQDEAH